MNLNLLRNCHGNSWSWNSKYHLHRRALWLYRCKSQPASSNETCHTGRSSSRDFSGEQIVARGQFDTHPSFGLQFQVSSFDLKPPTHIAGIERYLASGIIKGIGKTYAKKIVDKFQESTLDVIEKQPEKLKQVEGLGSKRISSIHKSYCENKNSRSLLIALYALGITQNFALKLLKNYKEKALEKLKQNPYQIAKEMRGIGFKTADKIALAAGIKEDSYLRISHAIDHFFLGICSRRTHWL